MKKTPNRVILLFGRFNFSLVSPLTRGAGGLIFLEMSTYFVGVREGGQEFMGLIFLEMST